MAILAAKGRYTMPRVLLVEDEPQLRRIMTLNLAYGGYSVAEADSVDTAFEMHEIAGEAGVPFDLIVLETHLTDHCGWDLLRLLRSTPFANERLGSAPVIVISPLPVLPRRLAEFAPFAVLLKPFPIEALLRLVERAQQQSSQQTSVSA